MLDRVLKVFGKRLRRRRRATRGAPVREVTLDLDATQIVAEKENAQWTRKWEARLKRRCSDS